MREPPPPLPTHPPTCTGPARPHTQTLTHTPTHTQSLTLTSRAAASRRIASMTSGGGGGTAGGAGGAWPPAPAWAVGCACSWVDPVRARSASVSLARTMPRAAATTCAGEERGGGMKGQAGQGTARRKARRGMATGRERERERAAVELVGEGCASRQEAAYASTCCVSQPATGPHPPGPRPPPPDISTPAHRPLPRAPQLPSPPDPPPPTGLCPQPARPPPTGPCQEPPSPPAHRPLPRAHLEVAREGGGRLCVPAPAHGLEGGR